MKSIRIFLLKGKESMIDHIKSIQTLGCAYWKKARNKNLQVGDICYLYLIGKCYYQIRFRLEVVDISCVREDSSCWITPFKADNDCYKLISTAAMYMGDELSLDTLEEIGINRHSQFKELNEYQEDYLRKISGITSKNGRNDAKRLNIRVVTVSNDDKPKNRKTQRKADLRRRMVCKSLPVKE